jgi:hypothetical protein
MSWDKTEGRDFGHSSRLENFIRGLSIELANERNLRAKAEAKVERLRMALDKIANPLKYIQMEARAKGAELNGVYAIMLSKDPSYLQEIALAELDEDDDFEQ